MAWRDRLRPASFRGVPFSVEVQSGAHGRRTVLHEYPQKDTPYLEDMGRRTRRYTLQAFLLGDNYLDRLDSLLVACEQDGPGVLVHPVLGDVWAVNDVCEWTISTDRGGMAALSLVFVDAGALEFPSAAADGGAGVITSSASMSAAAAAAFSDTYTTEYGFWMIGEAVADAEADALEVVKILRSPLAKQIAGAETFATLLTETNWTALATDPDTYRGPFSTVLAAITALGEDGLGALTEIASLTLKAVLGAFDTVGMNAAEANEVALRDWLTREALAGACEAAAATEFSSWDEAIAARDTLSGLIDDQLGQDPDDDTYQSLIDLKTALIDEITTSAVDLAVLQDYEPPEVQSVFEVAQYMYGDGSRADEIVDRNVTPHPGFVSPSTTLRVLSS